MYLFSFNTNHKVKRFSSLWMTRLKTYLATNLKIMEPTNNGLKSIKQSVLPKHFTLDKSINLFILL